MARITPIKLKLGEKFKNDKKYFHEFFRERAKEEIALQIRSLRKRRELRQFDFAKKVGMGQSAVSRIEQADYAAWTFKTLIRVAETLDARVRIVFEPMESIVEQYLEKDQEENEKDQEENLPIQMRSTSADFTFDLDINAGEPKVRKQAEAVNNHFHYFISP